MTNQRFRLCVVAFVLLLGGCSGFAPTTLELVPRIGEDLPVDELAQAVAERLDPADFDEHDGNNLVMQVRDDLLFVRGVINSGSDGEMIELLNGSPDVRTVVLTTVPGSMNDEVNVSLGRKLRNAGMTMYLPAQGMVASGGTDLLISGSRRIVEPGAMVGVHSWGAFWRGGDKLPRDDPRHGLYLDYYRAMDVPEEFYWFTLESAPPEDIHWMTEDEIERYRISTVSEVGSSGELIGAVMRASSAVTVRPGETDDQLQLRKAEAVVEIILYAALLPSRA